MNNERPSTASNLSKSKSSSIIKWRLLRPSTATYHNKALNLLTYSPHAKLPKDTLGSYLNNSLPRPQSGIIKAKPTFKINTQAFSATSKAEISDNKQERVDLIQKLKKICNTRSFKLLKDTAKENKELKKDKNQENDIKTEIKRIWQTSNLQKKQISDEIFSFPENIWQNIKNSTELKSSPVIVPGTIMRKHSESHLFPIPENKTYHSRTLKIDSSQLHFYKKACEIKNFSFNLQNQRKNTGFKGKVILKSKSFKKSLKKF